MPIASVDLEPCYCAQDGTVKLLVYSTFNHDFVGILNKKLLEKLESSRQSGPEMTDIFKGAFWAEVQERLEKSHSADKILPPMETYWQV